MMTSEITRRDILRGSALLGTVCTCQAASGATCCSTPDLEPESVTIAGNTLTIDLTKAPSLDAPSAAVNILDAQRSLGIVLVRAAKRKFYAVSRNCTHGGHQPVSYNPKRGILQCNGFNHSIFSLTGEVLKGPAPDPLKSYPVTLRPGKLEIAL